MNDRSSITRRRSAESGRGSHGLTLTLALAVLPACSMIGGRPDGVPSRPVDVASVPDAVPRPEPKSRYGNPESYVVNGKRYYVRKDSKGFVERGIASWYGTKFHGRRTSSGETYDMYAMTAAHKTLPLPTYASVRNLNTDQTVVVRINDRGPFHDNRVIDLSYTAAVKLGIVKAGTGLVELRAIDPGNYRSQAAPVRESGSDYRSRGFFVQVGAFSDYDNAIKLKNKLEGLADELIHISEAVVGSRRLYRVRFGPITDIDVADRIVFDLGRYGVAEHRIVVDL